MAQAAILGQMQRHIQSHLSGPQSNPQSHKDHFKSDTSHNVRMEPLRIIVRVCCSPEMMSHHYCFQISAISWRVYRHLSDAVVIGSGLINID